MFPLTREERRMDEEESSRGEERRGQTVRLWMKKFGSSDRPLSSKLYTTAGVCRMMCVIAKWSGCKMRQNWLAGQL